MRQDKANKYKLLSTTRHAWTDHSIYTTSLVLAALSLYGCEETITVPIPSVPEIPVDTIECDDHEDCIHTSTPYCLMDADEVKGVCVSCENATADSVEDNQPCVCDEECSPISSCQEIQDGRVCDRVEIPCSKHDDCQRPGLPYCMKDSEGNGVCTDCNSSYNYSLVNPTPIGAKCVCVDECGEGGVCQLGANGLTCQYIDSCMTHDDCKKGDLPFCYRPDMSREGECIGCESDLIERGTVENGNECVCTDQCVEGSSCQNIDEHWICQIKHYCRDNADCTSPDLPYCYIDEEATDGECVGCEDERIEHSLNDYDSCVCTSQCQEGSSCQKTDDGFICRKDKACKSHEDCPTRDFPYCKIMDEMTEGECVSCEDESIEYSVDDGDECICTKQCTDGSTCRLNQESRMTCQHECKRHSDCSDESTPYCDIATNNCITCDAVKAFIASGRMGKLADGESCVCHEECRDESQCSLRPCEEGERCLNNDKICIKTSTECQNSGKVDCTLSNNDKVFHNVCVYAEIPEDKRLEDGYECYEGCNTCPENYTCDQNIHRCIPFCEDIHSVAEYFKGESGDEYDQCQDESNIYLRSGDKVFGNLNGSCLVFCGEVRLPKDFHSYTLNPGDKVIGLREATIKPNPDIVTIDGTKSLFIFPTTNIDEQKKITIRNLNLDYQNVTTFTVPLFANSISNADIDSIHLTLGSSLKSTKAPFISRSLNASSINDITINGISDSEKPTITFAPNTGDTGSIFNTINNSTISNININIKTIAFTSITNNNIGGVLGKVSLSNIENLRLSGNVNLTTTSSAITASDKILYNLGGIIGRAENTSLSNIELKGNIVFTDSLKEDTNARNIGGILGYYKKTAQDVNVIINNLSIDGNITIKTTSSSKSTENIGGIIGHALSEDSKASLQLSNLNFITSDENSDISTHTILVFKNITHLGGIAGQLSHVDLINPTVRNLSISLNDTSSTQIGGMVGLSSKTNTIQAPIINNLSINGTNSDYVGGIIGNVNDLSQIDIINPNIRIENITARDRIGGTVGQNLGTLVISNSSNNAEYGLIDSKKFDDLKNELSPKDRSTIIINNLTASKDNIGGIVGANSSSDNHSSSIMLSYLNIIINSIINTDDNKTNTDLGGIIAYNFNTNATVQMANINLYASNLTSHGNACGIISRGNESIYKFYNISSFVGQLKHDQAHVFTLLEKYKINNMENIQTYVNIGTDAQDMSCTPKDYCKNGTLTLNGNSQSVACFIDIQDYNGDTILTCP